MLTEIEPTVDSPDRISAVEVDMSWQRELREAVRSVPRLLELLELTPDDLPGNALEAATFPLRVPLSYVRRMQPGNPRDPLLLQVLPTETELAVQPGYVSDPLAEQAQAPAPGIIHKYRGRALLVTTQACAVHCRYCFRQHFPYADNRLSRDQWQGALDYLRAASDVHEVILSGGDPLSLTNKHLASLINDLEKIPHLTTLRIHSRTPIVLPSRLDTGFNELLARSRLQTVLVVHANHAHELNDEVRQALAPLRSQGVTLLNQAVLLRDVNDNLNAQKQLGHSLFACGVLPYYLHVLDPVQGAAHFDVPDTEARQLWQQLQAELPGYLVPRLAREVPGKAGKTWINP